MYLSKCDKVEILRSNNFTNSLVETQSIKTNQPLLSGFMSASAGTGITVPRVTKFKCNAGGLSEMCHKCGMLVP